MVPFLDDMPYTGREEEAEAYKCAAGTAGASQAIGVILGKDPTNLRATSSRFHTL